MKILGVYNIKVIKISYAAETIEKLRVNTGGNSTQNATLNKRSVELDLDVRDSGLIRKGPKQVSK